MEKKQQNQREQYSNKSAASQGFIKNSSLKTLAPPPFQLNASPIEHKDRKEETEENKTHQKKGIDIPSKSGPTNENAPIQRAVGLEIESPQDIQAYSYEWKPGTPNQLILGKHMLLYEGKGFRLETELSGKLEFVIEPPVNTTGELIAIVNQIQKVASDIMSAKTKSKMGADPEMIERGGKAKKMDFVWLHKAVKGGAKVLISKVGEFKGGMQATVGIKLAAIPALFHWLDNELEDGAWPSEDKTVGNEALKSVQTSRPGDKGSLPLSPQMKGLLTMINYYILVGRGEGESSFPKAVTQKMARTNFAKMFSMTPEAAHFNENKDEWIHFVTNNLGVDPERPVFLKRFYGIDPTSKDKKEIPVKIRDWLFHMTGTVKEPGKDTLTAKESGEEILKTMGNMNKTDVLGTEAKDQGEGVIVELRGLDQKEYPIGEWDKIAKLISLKIEELNKQN